jgi:hypothetical protein
MNMKKFTLLLTLLFLQGMNSYAQHLLEVGPNKSNNLSNQIFYLHGLGTHFKDASTRSFVFYNELDTAYGVFQGSSMNERVVFTLPGFLKNGLYDLAYTDNYDTLLLPHALILDSNYSEIINYPQRIIADSSHWVSFSINSNRLQKGIDSAYFFNATEQFRVDSLFIPNNSTANFLIKTPNNAVGYYDLQLFISDSTMEYYKDVLFVKNTNQHGVYAHLDTIVQNHWQFGDTVVIHGHQTHFAQDTPKVLLGYETYGFDPQLSVINDTLLTITIRTYIVKSIFYCHTKIFLSNSMDSVLACPITLGVYGHIDKITKNLSDLKIYPNPAQDYIHIQADELAKEEQVEVKIFSLEGKEMYSQIHSGAEDIQINGLQLANGQYILRLKSKNFSEVRIIQILH